MNLTDTFVPSGNMTAFQKHYLFDNVIDAVKHNMLSNNKQVITLSADTGQGKTWMIVNYLIPEMIRLGCNNFIYIAPETGVVRQTQDEAFNFLNATIISSRSVNIITSEMIPKYINGSLQLRKSAINIFFTTKQYFLKYKDIFCKGILKPSLTGKWTMFDDEAHQHTGTHSHADIKADTNRTNKKALLSTSRALREFSRAGADIIQLSATLTNSQKGNTPSGKRLFYKLPTMPRDPLLTTFGNFTTVSAVDANNYWDFSTLLSKGLQLFVDHCVEVNELNKAISNRTWNILNTHNESKFATVMPDLIIKTGKDGATNGLEYRNCINYIENFCNKFNMILVDLVKNTYNGYPVKDTGEMIRLINENPKCVHILVVKEKLTVGANIPTLTHAIVVRTPSSKIHNNYSQFLGRMTRMPFFRNHEEAKKFIHNLDIDFDQKTLLCNYYALMNWAHAIVPEESELLASRVNIDDDTDFINETVMDFRLRGVWSLDEGKKYLFDGLQESCSGANKFGYTISRLTTEQANFIKEKFCQDCPRDENGLPKCLTNLYEAHGKGYKHLTEEEFFNSTGSSMIVREHKNGNHYDNDPKNIKFVCANLSALKTDIYKDYNQRYDIVNGKKVPRKINQFDV